MSIQTISRSAIKFNPNDRAREKYTGIEELADSIKSATGLIQPIVLSPVVSASGELQYQLDDGGRRLSACDYLGYDTFYFGNTGVVGQPGFVLAKTELGEDDKLMRELVANLHRENFTWVEEMKLLVTAFRRAAHKEALEGRKLTYTDFGSKFGWSYNEMASSCLVYDDFLANPDDYKDCTGVHGAYMVKLRKAQQAAEKALAERTKAKLQQSITSTATTNSTTNVETPQYHYPMSNLKLGNSIEHLESLKSPLYDAIITDPDFAIDVEKLNSKSTSAGQGVVQSSVEESLSDLARFIRAAYNALHSHGYLVFFYDLDHHEKLQRLCSDVGFAVQRWPIIWHKTDFGSNANPSKNTTKNIEYAMVASKAHAKLAKPGSTSVISVPLQSTNDALGHPFAKPAKLWQELFDRFVHPGFLVFDGFMGAGSMPIAAIGRDMRVVGYELQESHFNRCLLNVEAHLKKQYGANYKLY